MKFLHDHTCIPVVITWNGQMDVTADGKSLSLSIARKIHLYRATQSQDSLTTRLVAPQKKAAPVNVPKPPNLGRKRYMLFFN